MHATRRAHVARLAILASFLLSSPAHADTRWTVNATVMDIDQRLLAGVQVAVGTLNNDDKFKALESGITDDTGKVTVSATTESRSARVVATVVEEPIGRVHEPVDNRVRLQPGTSEATFRLLPMPDSEASIGGGEATTAGFFTTFGAGSRYPALETETVPIDPSRMVRWAARVALGRPPVLLVQGLPLSTTQVAPMEVYNQLFPLVEALRQGGRDVWILEFADAKDPVAGNALAVSDAVSQAAALAGEVFRRVDVVGISLGGVIARYALARDEAENGPSKGKVRVFASVDAPHQGANVPRALQAGLWLAGGRQPREIMSSYALQNFLYEWVGPENWAKKSCGFPVNREIYPSTAAHDWFFQRLNALNGDGHPHLCRRVALANGGPSPRRPKEGDVMYTARASLDVLIGSVEVCREDYRAGPLDILPGSLPPQGLVPTRISSNGIRFDLDAKFEPTFIPTASALDIRDGRSLFDTVFIPSGGPYPHGTLPPGALDFLLGELLL
jgi:hypothetical protein